ncbi:PaaI family thioesterase, partial [Acinetobacter baumannii]
GGIPHYGALGVQFVTAGRNAATLRLPYREDFIGDPETGTLHGGVITTLIDSVCGISVFMAMGRLLPIATLDLRIDYLKPATAGLDVLAVAE